MKTEIENRLAFAEKSLDDAIRNECPSDTNYWRGYRDALNGIKKYMEEQ